MIMTKDHVDRIIKQNVPEPWKQNHYNFNGSPSGSPRIESPKRKKKKIKIKRRSPSPRKDLKLRLALGDDFST